MILFSGACVAAYQATFFAAVDDTGVAVGTVVAIGSAPVFTGLLARTFASERLTRRWAGATALGCLGVCTLVLGSGSGGEVTSLPEPEYLPRAISSTLRPSLEITPIKP